MASPTYCVRHKNSNTKLKCGKCENPICHICVVHSPVGIRCIECAPTKSLPTFDVPLSFLIRAMVVGSVIGILSGGIIVFLIPLINNLIYMGIIVAVGYVVSEMISIVVNRKRGRKLKLVTTASILITWIIVSMFSVVPLSLFGILATAVAIYIAASRF